MQSFNAETFIRSVTSQAASELREYFTPDAVICWHNTNECFTVEEYIRANCEYPGTWDGLVERIEYARDAVIVVAKIWDTEAAYRVTSFISLTDDKISRLDEYWGDIGDAPEWRRDMKLGSSMPQKGTALCE